MFCQINSPLSKLTLSKVVAVLQFLTIHKHSVRARIEIENAVSMTVPRHTATINEQPYFPFKTISNLQE